MQTIKSRLVWGVLGASAIAILSPVVQAQGVPAAATLPTAAPAYLAMAASGDQFEIQSSQLALQLSRDAQVKQAAQMIINDHMRLSGALAAAAASAKVPPPPGALAPHHAQMLEQLRSGSAATFDGLYRQQQVQAHEEALALHRSYASNGDVAALRQAASQAVPVIEMHLQHIQSLLPGATASPTSATPTAEQRAGERG